MKKMILNGMTLKMMKTMNKKYNMKYLKRFESSNVDHLIESLQDIFKDLSEDGFDVYIENKVFFTSDILPTLRISIYKNTSGIEDSPAEDIYIYEIKDYFKRAIDYLRSEGFEISDVIPYGSKNISIYESDVENWNPDDIVMAMNLYFKEI